jgi:hypothetical protein
LQNSCLKGWASKTRDPLRQEAAVAILPQLPRQRLRSIRGPEAVPAYLSRYTHHAAIDNSRLISADEYRILTFLTAAVYHLAPSPPLSTEVGSN